MKKTPLTEWLKIFEKTFLVEKWEKTKSFFLVKHRVVFISTICAICFFSIVFITISAFSSKDKNLQTQTQTLNSGTSLMSIAELDQARANGEKFITIDLTKKLPPIVSDTMPTVTVK